MASPEKAILDTLYYRRTIPAKDELELDNVDFDVLSKMAEIYPKSVRHTILSLSGRAKTFPTAKIGRKV